LEDVLISFLVLQSRSVIGQLSETEEQMHPIVLLPFSYAGGRTIDRIESTGQMQWVSGPSMARFYLRWGQSINCPSHDKGQTGLHLSVLHNKQLTVAVRNLSQNQLLATSYDQ